MHRIHHNGPRLGAFLFEECLSLHSLGVGHRDSAQHGVGPVYVAVDPVHRQPVGGLEVLADDGVVGGGGRSVNLGAEGRAGEAGVGARDGYLTQGWAGLRLRLT